MHKKKIFQTIQLLGALMFASGCALPFIVGTRISPLAYNILQIGGPILLISGWIAKKFVKNSNEAASQPKE
jgi:hypothetical protein